MDKTKQIKELSNFLFHRNQNSREIPIQEALFDFGVSIPMLGLMVIYVVLMAFQALDSAISALLDKAFPVLKKSEPEGK